MLCECFGRCTSDSSIGNTGNENHLVFDGGGEGGCDSRCSGMVIGIRMRDHGGESNDVKSRFGFFLLGSYQPVVLDFTRIGLEALNLLRVASIGLERQRELFILIAPSIVEPSLSSVQHSFPKSYPNLGYVGRLKRYIQPNNPHRRTKKHNPWHMKSLHSYTFAK